MRDKILAQLQTKFAGVSKTALGLSADKISKKVTEESGIDQAITDFDNAVSITEFAADLQRESDRRVTEAKKQWDKDNPKPQDPQAPNPKDPPKPDDMPAWAKSLVEQVTNLTREKAQGSIKEKAGALLKDVPAQFWNGRSLPEKEEDLQTFVDAVNADYSAMKQEFINAGLMSATPPDGGGGEGGAGVKLNDKQIEAEINDWASKSKATPVSTDKK